MSKLSRPGKPISFQKYRTGLSDSTLKSVTIPTVNGRSTNSRRITLKCFGLPLGDAWFSGSKGDLRFGEIGPRLPGRVAEGSVMGIRCITRICALNGLYKLLLNQRLPPDAFKHPER